MSKDKVKRRPIMRKAILTTSCRRNAQNHPEFLDTEALLERFEPLLRSIHKKFCSYDGVFNTPEDQADLWAQIQYEFLRLRQTFDPRRGVDFPGYLKFHLQQRVYHYVTKQQKLSNTEQPMRVYSDDFEEKPRELEKMPELVDEETPAAMERTEAIESIPWDRLSEEQAELVREIIFNKKLVETIAKERKVSIKSVKTQLDEICELFIKIHQESEQED